MLRQGMGRLAAVLLSQGCLLFPASISCDLRVDIFFHLGGEGEGGKADRSCTGEVEFHVNFLCIAL